MKILVPFKSVPDPNGASVTGAAASTPKSVINPFDEIAIEEALRIRERGDAAEIVGITIGTPAVNEPRYVSLPGLMKARRKPIEILTCDHLRVTVRPLTTVLSTTRPPNRATGTRVESVEELVVKLRQEAKVL